MRLYRMGDKYGGGYFVVGEAAGDGEVRVCTEDGWTIMGTGDVRSRARRVDASLCPESILRALPPGALLPVVGKPWLRAPDRIHAGDRFGRLTVTGPSFSEQCTIRSGKNAGSVISRKKYPCVCDCGNTIGVYDFSLLKGKVKSCGCLQPRVERDSSEGRMTAYTAAVRHGVGIGSLYVRVRRGESLDHAIAEIKKTRTRQGVDCGN